MTILTGLLLVNVGVKSNPFYEDIMGYMFITFGVINLLFILMKHGNNRGNR